MIEPIEPYRMPEADQLPQPVPPWKPEPARTALLIHDLQRYFAAPFDPARPPLADLLANVDRLRRLAHARGIPVFYTVQPPRMSPATRGLLADFWGRGMTGDPDGARIVAVVAPEAGDVIVEKYRYSAFHGTGLAGALRARDRDQLVICGVYAHIGVLATAGDAYARDIQPFLAADAVADFSRADHWAALRHAARTCAVVRSTDCLIDQLGGAVAADVGEFHP